MIGWHDLCDQSARHLVPRRDTETEDSLLEEEFPLVAEANLMRADTDETPDAQEGAGGDREQDNRFRGKFEPFLQPVYDIDRNALGAKALLGRGFSAIMASIRCSLSAHLVCLRQIV